MHMCSTENKKRIFIGFFNSLHDICAKLRCFNVDTRLFVLKCAINRYNLLLFRIKDVKWHIKDGTLHHILPIYNSGVEVTSFDTKTGEKLKTRRVSAPFISQETE